MSFKKIVTKSISLALVGITISTPTLSSVSAMEKSNDFIPTSINQVVKSINNLDELIKYAKSTGASIHEIRALNDLKDMSFDNSSLYEESNEKKSDIIKTAVKWLKNNLSKVQKFVKTYFGITISVKWLTSALDVIADISGTLDELTYNLVDLICDTFSIRCSENNKWIIARALRLIMPI